MASNSESTPTNTVLYVIVVVVAVLVASVLAPVVWSATQPSDDGEVQHPSVAVITMRGPTQGAIAHGIVEDLRQARNNDSIRAVVLRVDSGGGAVATSEELYLAVNATAREMPVVTYVEGTAASGAYYTIAPSDAIYVKPGSMVGSIGVVATVPEVVELTNEERQVFIRSGPNKQITSVDQLRNTVESLQNAFLGTVMKHRGDALALSRQEVARANVYMGTRAVENGFADEVGSLQSAIRRAAEESDAIDGGNYTVQYKEPAAASSTIIISGEDVERVNGSLVYVDAGDRDGTEFVPPVRFYAVWGIPESNVADGESEVSANETG